MDAGNAVSSRQQQHPRSDPGLASPEVMADEAHPISNRDIPLNALKILKRLDDHGYKAYLVGGAVRDLLLGGHPKDFDVGTDASPGQIRRLFRNSRIIGRRFKLAHVYFQDEVIEVSTFRAEPHPDTAVTDEPIARDNRYGTPEEDARRRDFTVNALFYDYASCEVVDHVGGLQDIRRHVIRSIGPAVERFREDPVRMLRACEFAARLDFTLDGDVQDAIVSEREWLEHASPSRLVEELLQLLGCGSFGPAMQWMTELRLSEVYLPSLGLREASGRNHRAGDYYTELDRRVRAQAKPSDAALLGALLLPVVENDLISWHDRHNKPAPAGAIKGAILNRVNLLEKRFAISNARGHDTLAALQAFVRMRRPGWKPQQRAQLARKPYFADALELWELYAVVDKVPQVEIDEWHKAAEQARGGPPPKRPGQRPKKGRRGGRRRRRRK